METRSKEMQQHHGVKHMVSAERIVDVSTLDYRYIMP